MIVSALCGLAETPGGVHLRFRAIQGVSRNVIVLVYNERVVMFKQ